MRRFAVVAATVALVLAAAGCGSSSKPSYCSNVNDFKNAVQGLTSVNVSKNGVSAIKTQIDKIESTGKSVESSAKSDFPNETSALKSSLTSLQATLKQLSDPSTQSAALKQLPAQVVAVTSAAKSFDSATSSKCK